MDDVLRDLDPSAIVYLRRATEDRLRAFGRFRELVELDRAALFRTTGGSERAVALPDAVSAALEAAK